MVVVEDVHDVLDSIIGCVLDADVGADSRDMEEAIEGEGIVEDVLSIH